MNNLIVPRIIIVKKEYNNKLIKLIECLSLFKLIKKIKGIKHAKEYIKCQNSYYKL